MRWRVALVGQALPAIGSVYQMNPPLLTLDTDLLLPGTKSRSINKCSPIPAGFTPALTDGHTVTYFCARKLHSTEKKREKYRLPPRALYSRRSLRTNRLRRKNHRRWRHSSQLPCRENERPGFPRSQSDRNHHRRLPGERLLATGRYRRRKDDAREIQGLWLLRPEKHLRKDSRSGWSCLQQHDRRGSAPALCAGCRQEHCRNREDHRA